MAQFVRPDTDLVAGLWTATPLWSKVDEGAPGDDVTILSEAVGNNTDTTNADLQGSDVTDPNSSTGYILRAAWNSTGNSVDGTLELYQGVPGVGTLIATLTQAALTTTESTATHSLTATEADSISDHAALNFRLRGRGTQGGPSRSLEVDFIELEVPDASGAVSGEGSSSGAGMVSGILAAIAQAAGSALGVAAATGAAVALALSIGAAAGTSTATAAGASVVAAQGAAAGTSTVTADGQASGGGSVGAAVGASTATGVGQSIATSTGTASGAATVSGDIQATGPISAEGSTAGLSTALGVSGATAQVVGSASAAASVDGRLAAVTGIVGTAAGTSDAAAVSNVFVPSPRLAAVAAGLSDPPLLSANVDQHQHAASLGGNPQLRAG